MSMHDVDKSYVSPFDKFLYEFDAKHEKSESQQKEINKFKRIFDLRDNKRPESDKFELWEEF